MPERGEQNVYVCGECGRKFICDDEFGQMIINRCQQRGFGTRCAMCCPMSVFPGLQGELKAIEELVPKVLAAKMSLESRN